LKRHVLVKDPLWRTLQRAASALVPTHGIHLYAAEVYEACRKAAASTS